MPKYQGPNPISGPYNVPAGSNIIGGGKYNRIISASATFICTGSNGGCIGVSTGAGCTVTLTGGGSLIIPASTTNPLIYEVSVAQLTAGSAYLYYS